MAKDVQVSPKRRISYMFTNVQSSLATEYEMVKIEWRKDCVCCKGLRLGDRPQKKMALKEIATNQGRESKRTCTIYSCKQYNVVLCKKRSCWKKYYRIE
jgi:hypothetical protein